MIKSRKPLTKLLVLWIVLSHPLWGSLSNQANIATDSVTGLMWQDEPYGDAEEEAYLTGSTTQKVGTWEYAKGHCTTLTLGGYHDWRLPTIYELLTLSDDTKLTAPYVVEGISNLSSGSYWSATSYDSRSVLIANPQLGYLENDAPSLVFYTRCVRGNPLTPSTLVRLKREGKLLFSLPKIDTLRKLY